MNNRNVQDQLAYLRQHLGNLSGQHFGGPDEAFNAETERNERSQSYLGETSVRNEL